MNQESFVYCWTDHLKEMLYIGSHKGDLDDGYICSSKYMLQEYNIRPDDFTRQIVAQGIDADMRNFESKLLKQIDAANNPEYYNMHNGDGKFTTAGTSLTNVHKQKISKAVSGKKHPLYGTICSDETKAKISKANKGRKLSIEHIEKLRQTTLNRKFSEEKNKEIFKKISESLKGKPSGMLNKKHSNESKQKMSMCQVGKKNSFYGRKHTEEHKYKIKKGARNKFAKTIQHILKYRDYLIYQYNYGNSYKELGLEYKIDPRVIKKVIDGYYCGV